MATEIWKWEVFLKSIEGRKKESWKAFLSSFE
jgi:hypothetical protein